MTLPKFYYCQGTTYLFYMYLGPILAALLGADHIALGENGAPNRYVQGVNGEFYLWDSFPDDPFPKLLDPTLWDARKINYPASTLFMGPSIEQAVSQIVTDIQASPVGTPFALGGYSQGAAVASRIYQETRSGVLKDRRADLRAMITMGNPMRETDHTYPGSSGYSGRCDVPGSTTGGHGTFPSLDMISPLAYSDIGKYARLQNTDSFVWDFTQPNEVIGGVGDSTNGQLMQTFTRDGLTALPLAALLTIQQVVTNADSLWNRFGIAPSGVSQTSAHLINVTDPKTGSVAAVPGGGHIMYPWFPPPNADGSPGTGDTCYQIAVKYLNKVGAQIYDQLNPTVVAPTSPAGYQWFTNLPNG